MDRMEDGNERMLGQHLLEPALRLAKIEATRDRRKMLDRVARGELKPREKRRK